MGLLLGGCKQPAETTRPEEILVAQENARLRRQIVEQDQQIAELRRQVAALRGLSTESIEHLVHVERIAFGRFTRCEDKDQDGIDDGLVVYLELRDRQGDKIKAAGRVLIELWDLAAAEDDRQLGQWHFGPEEALNHWLPGILADHFKFDLPWPHPKKPQHENLTVKLVFTDALTGKVFEIQKLIEAKVAVKAPNNCL